MQKLYGGHCNNDVASECRFKGCRPAEFWSVMSQVDSLSNLQPAFEGFLLHNESCLAGSCRRMLSHFIQNCRSFSKLNR